MAQNNQSTLFDNWPPGQCRATYNLEHEVDPRTVVLGDSWVLEFNCMWCSVLGTKEVDFSNVDWWSAKDTSN